MEFFVPAAKDESQAQRVWQATKNFAEETLNWKVSKRRIHSIPYRHEGAKYLAEIGKSDPRLHELVIVILESNTFSCVPRIAAYCVASQC